jgi:hypothetical protein
MPYDAGVIRLGVVVIVLTLAAARPARAQCPQYPAITSRAYAIDLYNGVAIGNTDMVGMGGAGAAVVLGTAGVLMNPSAIAVRPTTDNDRWSLDYHLDFLTGTYSSDYDNNGCQVESGGALLLTGGLGGRLGNWGAAFTSLVQLAPVVGSMLTANARTYRVVLSRWIPQIDLAVGGGIQGSVFELVPPSGSALFSISGIGLVAGATWLPHGESYRLAVALNGAIDGGEVQPGSCSPDDCMGYILPARARAPARLVAGGAYRWAPTAWNQQVPGPFRDEYSLILAADLVVTGATASGAGVEAFGMHELQPSGRHTVVSVRGGLAAEVMPGRLRLRGGSYWEPGRFEGVGGRTHATFGIDLRVLKFPLFGERRGRISLTGDVADRYRNIVASIGFWH